MADRTMLALHKCGHTAERPILRYSATTQGFRRVDEKEVIYPPQLARARKQTQTYFGKQLCPGCYGG